jgi:hypothetical protein
VFTARYALSPYIKQIGFYNKWRVFTARYALSPYIKQIGFYNKWRVFTARYALSPYIKQIRCVFEGLKSCHCTCYKVVGRKSAGFEQRNKFWSSRLTRCVPHIYEVAHCQGAQIPGAGSRGILNFVRPRVIFVVPQYRACWMPPFWRLEFSGGF